MKFLEKLTQKAQNNKDFEGVTVAFLGDSVTQGCFEIYKDSNNVLRSVYDKRNSYEQLFYDMMAMLYPTVPVNIVNAGIEGDTARRGAMRVERDITRHAPDLTIVCYGLNDCADTEEGIPRYVNALASIFSQVEASGSDLIFMTPNMMNTEISHTISDPDFLEIAKTTAKKQNSGMFDAHIEAAKALCRERNIPVCDCYSIWKSFYHAGINTTELLSNKINHPTREMNRIFAYELIKTIVSSAR